jgi:integrase
LLGTGYEEIIFMRRKLTKRIVDGATSGNTDCFIWDTEVKGFGVKITPTGRRIYILQYRRGGRRAPTKRITIGRHGAVTAEQARRIAIRLCGAIADGGDPAAARAVERMAPTVADLVARFLSEHVATKTKPQTAAEYRRVIETSILPALGRRRIREVTRVDMTRLHHERRATPYVANRILAVLSKMFNLAEKWGERPDGSNPCRHVEKFRERKRERMLSPEEFARLGDALATSDQSLYAVTAVKLLVFTGARLSEVLGLRWEWIDFGRGEARLPDSKTGAKVLHLPPPALAVLADLPRVAGNPHVVVGGVPGAALVNLEKPWRAVRSAARLPDVRLHDLRHAFASVAVTSGLGLPIVGKILGHTQAATTHRYAHLASDPVKAAAAVVAGKIADAMNAQNPAVEVVPRMMAGTIHDERVGRSDPSEGRLSNEQSVAMDSVSGGRHSR